MILYFDEKMIKSKEISMRTQRRFPEALKKKEFKVYYQPKFDVRPDTPVLTSAEALVRWIHPELGMISPGDFIPLFEENGVIQQLDNYVWEEAARQIRDWKDRLNYSIPVSSVAHHDGVVLWPAFSDAQLGELVLGKKTIPTDQGSVGWRITGR